MDLRFVSYDQGIIQNFAARSKHSFHGISSALITILLLRLESQIFTHQTKFMSIGLNETSITLLVQTLPDRSKI